VTVPRPASAEDFEFTSDGLKLRGWRFRGAGRRRGTLVYLHGSADNRASGISIATRFLERGFDVLAYDSRAHGESEGAACTYGYHEKRDLSRAIDLVAHPPVVALGVSLGGAVALQAAAEDPRIVAVIAIATFSDIRTVATERAPFIASAKDLDAALRLAEQQASFKVDETSPVLAAPRIRGRVMLVHGQADTDTLPAHSERVFAALRGKNNRLLLVPGAGHNDVFRPDVWREIDAWLDVALGS
jgi:dipeptidyl aminopeptidase/acylaminoacyl peptidase